MNIERPDGKPFDSGALIVGTHHRYLLWRRWNPLAVLPPLVWIMLNPSTADAERDDRTIRRTMGFTHAGGARHHQGVVIANLFALRSTSPEPVRTSWTQGFSEFAVGPLNDDIIRFLGQTFPVGICAWGTFPWARARAEYVTGLLRASGMVLLCLGTTKDGDPRHPLYVKGDTDFESYRGSPE